MHKFLLLLLLLSAEIAFPQSLPHTPMPPGYPGSKTRYRNDLKIDNYNNVWIAFDSIGLARYDGSAWTIYDVANGSLPSNQVHCVDIDSFNNVYAGTSKGLSIYHLNGWEHFDSINSTIPVSGVTAVKYSAGTIYAGSNDGLHIYNGLIWAHLNSSNSALGNDSITCLYKLSGDDLAMGTRKGIYIYSQGTITPLAASIPDRRIKKMVYDNKDRLWITTASNKTYYYDLNLNTTIDFYSKLPIPEYGCTYFGDTTSVASEYDSGVLIAVRDPNTSQFFLAWSDTSGHLSYSKFNFTWMTWYQIFADVKDSMLVILSDFSVFSSISNFHIINLNDFARRPLTSYFLEPSNLNVNNVNTRINNLSDHHWDRVTQNASHEVPICSGKHSAFTCGLWMAGLDSIGSLHEAATTWNMPNYYDYWAGPLDTTDATTDSATVAAYDRVWKINKTTINEFIYNFQQGNVTNGSYPVPDIILDWPAYGDGNFSRSLAPFTDVNNDGIYDPYQGDYPDMEGDQMIWFIFNDGFAAHTVSDAPALGFEIHGKAYAYACDSAITATEALNYTTFYQYKIINRSSNAYHDMRLGWWQPNGIGDATDDYFKCTININTVTEYNSDIDDGPWGYGQKPPFQNITLLKGPVADPGDGIDNDRDGITDEPGETIGLSSLIYYVNSGNDPQGRPHLADDYYQYLNAIWLDGLPLTYGADGRNQLNPPCKYAFPDNSDTSFTVPWNMALSGIHGYYYRKVLGFGNFSMAPGEERTIDMAYIYSRDTVGSWPADAEAKNLHDVNSILYWYNNNLLGNCPLPVAIEEYQDHHQSAMLLYPNPASEYMHVMNINVAQKYYYKITDTNGRLLQAGQLKAVKIPMRNLDPGVYYLHLYNDTENFSGKFLKIQ